MYKGEKFYSEDMGCIINLKCVSNYFRFGAWRNITIETYNVYRVNVSKRASQNCIESERSGEREREVDRKFMAMSNVEGVTEWYRIR